MLPLQLAKSPQNFLFVLKPFKFKHSLKRKGRGREFWYQGLARPTSDKITLSTPLWGMSIYWLTELKFYWSANSDTQLVKDILLNYVTFKFFSCVCYCDTKLQNIFYSTHFFADLIFEFVEPCQVLVKSFRCGARWISLRLCGFCRVFSWRR